jgi:hypothetical protein
MRSRDGSPLERLKRPEYTGENRCMPCTVLNVAIAGVLTLVAAVLGPISALAVFGASMASIYYRGYLIPGTPALTQRYLPDPVLAAFGKAPDGPRDGWEGGEPTVVTEEVAPDDGEGAGSTAEAERSAAADDEYEFQTVERIEDRRENAVDPVSFLLDVGVVEETDGPEQLAFEPAFADRVAETVADIDRDAVDRETLAVMFGVEPDEVSFEGRSYPAVTVRRRIRKWPGDAAFLSDVASHLALADRTDRWLDVPSAQRLSILQSLRSFHDTCPACGGELVSTSDTVESCCLAHEVVAIRCEGCGEHVLELDPKEVSRDAESTGITP